jgi:hypothetical protein
LPPALLLPGDSDGGDGGRGVPVGFGEGDGVSVASWLGVRVGRGLSLGCSVGSRVGWRVGSSVGSVVGGVVGSVVSCVGVGVSVGFGGVVVVVVVGAGVVGATEGVPALPSRKAGSGKSTQFSSCPALVMNVVNVRAGYSPPKKVLSPPTPSRSRRPSPRMYMTAAASRGV